MKTIKWYWKNTITKVILVTFWTTIMSFKHFPKMFIQSWFPKYEKYYGEFMGIPAENIKNELKLNVLESDKALTNLLSIDYQCRIHSTARRKNLKVISFANDGIIVAPIKKPWFEIFIWELFSFRIKIYKPEGDECLTLSLHYGNHSVYSDFY